MSMQSESQLLRNRIRILEDNTVTLLLVISTLIDQNNVLDEHLQSQWLRHDGAGEHGAAGLIHEILDVGTRYRGEPNGYCALHPLHSSFVAPRPVQ